MIFLKRLNLQKSINPTTIFVLIDSNTIGISDRIDCIYVTDSVVLKRSV